MWGRGRRLSNRGKLGGAARVVRARLPAHHCDMSAHALPSPADIISFWREAGPQKWYAKDAAFDASIRDRFLAAFTPDAPKPQ